MRIRHIVCALCVLAFPGAVMAEEANKPVMRLSMDAVVSIALASDTEFDQILIDQLRLKYREDLTLPARDLVLSVKQDYTVFIDQDREAAGTDVSLSKLFPKTGTRISASYTVSPSLSSDTSAGGVGFSISQPIGRNAFGHSTRLLEKIVGLETDVARYQIIEAYEDYLAAVMVAHRNWDEAYRKLEVGKSSYLENLKLLDNIKARARKQVANAVDINKVNLLVLAKKERLIELEEEYGKRLNDIRRMIRDKSKLKIIPLPSPVAGVPARSVDALLDRFVRESRTFIMLTKLEQKSKLKLDREARDLLPSINLVAGVARGGTDYDLSDAEDSWSAGLELSWPLPGGVNKAEKEVARIDAREAELAKENATYRLRNLLRNLHSEIRKERRLLAVADQKIKLAESILAEEIENYSFGKITLNDYISAVNSRDTQRFNKITHEARYARLVVEWQRLTDELVKPSIILRRAAE